MKRKTDPERDRTVIDASLNCLVGDGEKTKDVLFKIKAGILKGRDAKVALDQAPYDDWKSPQPYSPE
jgi:hypothetical protein